MSDADPRSAADRAPPAGRRIAELDIARSLALLAMAVFHLAWDLTSFGFLPRDTMQAPEWRAFARLIAGSFLFLSGISLWLAHGSGLRTAAFLRRLWMLAAMAALVSVATRIALPQAWIRFGILHALVVSSCLGLAAMHLPRPLLALAAVGALALGAVELPGAGAAWLWLGIAAHRPPMLDYVPILPWSGVFLAGILAARCLAGRIPAPLDPATRAVRLAAWPGRHSLMLYLAHQPILYGAVYLARQIAG
ncbi:heparan-alpha-glucosaminide N-acetyltransferase [Salipiger sp.]|uniref:heparan-alpha-glucosaminide N-acetyltransferase n=1 Tax=Salipiger sp. TaxID=2078585 RepID=UPI003A96D54D